MPTMVVIQPNGLFARFSSVVDNFTHYNYMEDEIIKLYIDIAVEDARREAQKRATEAIAAARKDPTRYERVLKTIANVHGVEEAKRFVNPNYA